ncbi:MAG: carbon-nitrogen hydrolase family protein [Chloroflexota bacterium]
MGDEFPQIKVAVVQASPVVLDREATIAKACRLTAEAAAQGAKLVLFPEAFVPAYLWGLSLGTAIGGRTAAGRQAFARYWANAVEVPSPATAALGEAARQASVYLAIGVIERDSTFSRGTLYCTLLYFGPDGRLLAKHRKLKPTAAERYIWGEGDGSTLPVLATEVGKVGGLICWENYMPLARTAIYAQGVEIYLAPTADNRDSWQSTIRHIACEGRCFVLSCCQYLTKDAYPAELEVADELANSPQVLSRGGSAIVGPLGDYIAGPLFGQEGILYADLDFSLLAGAKFDMDVVGHYARADVLRLLVNTQAQSPVQWNRGRPADAVAPEVTVAWTEAAQTE